MANIKMLHVKLAKLKKERDEIGETYKSSGYKWSKLCDKVRDVQDLIKEAEIKDTAHPVAVGEWYAYSANKDVFFKVNRRLIDGSFELFTVNIHNKMPALTLVDMEQKEFFEKCLKIDQPPVEAILNKIRSFIEGGKYE